MPPPKKPKSGRTSLEQFLSDEERISSLNGVPRCHRSDSEGNSLRDSGGNSPVGSVDLEGSDGEVFDSSKQAYSTVEIGLPTCIDSEQLIKNQERINLLQRLFRKSRSIDEQKVPGSPDRELPSPTSSPISDPDKSVAFKKFEEHVKMQIEKKHELEGEGYSKENGTFLPKSHQSYEHCDIDGNANHQNVDNKMSIKANLEDRLTSEQGRLIDTLVASALASNAAQSIIYAQRPVNDTAEGQRFPHGQCVSQSTMKSYDSEPHDLSKRSEMNGKLLNHKLYENLNNTSDFMNYSHAYREFTVERNKHYLDTRRNVAGLLSERPDDVRSGHDRAAIDRTPVQIMEKENIVQSVPARYPNGFFHQVGLNGVMGTYSRYEQQQRESLDRAMGKIDESGAMISPGGYLPVHSMMPPASAGQTPTSTTMDPTDMRDRFHPAFMNQHLMVDSRRMKHEHSHSSNVNKLCQVCSDNASGFHYGVWSCEGCKAFFKRSIQGPVDYVCPATNTCTIDKHRRKSCQACRLRKCYEVGMNKGSQRKDRKSSGTGTNTKCPKRPRSDSGESNGTSPTPAKNSRKSRTSIIIEALSKADLPNLESYHNHSLPPTRVHLLNSLVKLAERELVFLINWAKNVPGYTALSLGDQVHLIECCWMELLLLNCAFRSMEHNGRRLAFAPDLVLERPYWSTVGMPEVLEQVAAVSDQMVQYNLHREEVLLLQATILANAEVRKLASYSKLHEIQQSLLDGLVDVAQKYHPDNLRHIPSILLLLTHIRQAADRATTYFQSLKKEGSVNFCDLLTEMLDAQSDDKNTLTTSAGC